MTPCVFVLYCISVHSVVSRRWRELEGYIQDLWDDGGRRQGPGKLHLFLCLTAVMYTWKLYSSAGMVYQIDRRVGLYFTYVFVLESIRNAVEVSASVVLCDLFAGDRNWLLVFIVVVANTVINVVTNVFANVVTNVVGVVVLLFYFTAHVSKSKQSQPKLRFSIVLFCSWFAQDQLVQTLRITPQCSKALLVGLC